MIKIRKFSLSDVDKVMAIDRVSFPQPWSKSFFKKISKKYPKDFLVAENSEKKVIGYILGYLKSNGLGSIKTIAVAPDYRNRGIGTELVNFLINRLKKGGVKKVFLHSRTKNQVAKSFYQKFGFEIVKTIKNYYRNGDNAYVMKLESGG